MIAQQRKRNQSFIQEWEVIPIALISIATWALSWLLWNWRETVMDLTRFITPPQPFAWLGQVIPFIGTARFTDAVLIILAIFSLYVLMSNRWKSKQQGQILRVIVHGVAAMITYRVFWDIWHWLHLNSQWYQETIFFTGKVAITFLFLSLACTPLITLFGWSALTQLKKPLGNWGFGYVLLHFLLFTVDNGFVSDQFEVGLVIDETIQKQYALIGFAAFVLLIPLFVTSNKWSQKVLKKNWKKLHQLVYIIGILSATHYIWVWLSKRALTEPIIYAVVLVLLLVLRIKPVKDWIRDFKKGRQQVRKVRATA
ncbi:ferric reductase-like transmembrane domain-containing protein [Chloroflexi bacterium TSY]|nr:ferric reductase-like transmembrane domain-containing protein [Chloroflexi bacterium TSY]